jgi:hypothetical protein
LKKFLKSRHCAKGWMKKKKDVKKGKRAHTWLYHEHLFMSLQQSVLWPQEFALNTAPSTVILPKTTKLSTKPGVQMECTEDSVGGDPYFLS